MDVKTCTKCSQTKPLLEFYLKPDGKLSCWCKECHKLYSRERYRNKSDEIIAKSIEWQKAHKDKVKEYMQTYRRKMKAAGEKLFA